MQATNAKPVIRGSKFRTFGSFGPKYEVGEPLRKLDDGDWMVKIRLVESGEESEYRASRIENDPEAR